MYVAFGPRRKRAARSAQAKLDPFIHEPVNFQVQS